MDGNIIVTLVIGVLSSGALAALINNIFQNKRDKSSKENGLEAKVDTLSGKLDDLVAEQTEIRDALRKQEIDQIRTEMKLMIYNDPSKEEELLRMGQHYFEDLNANWTMGKTYAEWMRSRNITVPHWVRED